MSSASVRLAGTVTDILTREKTEPQQNIVDALAILAGVAKPKHVRKEKTPDPRKAKRLAHNASTADLRAFVWERCGGKCEASGADLGSAWELHHCQGGPSRRREQRPGNVLALSWDMHRRVHRGDLDALRAIAKAGPLDAEARRAAEYRVEKAARIAGVPVRIEVKETANG